MTCINPGAAARPRQTGCDNLRRAASVAVDLHQGRRDAPPRACHCRLPAFAFLRHPGKSRLLVNSVVPIIHPQRHAGRRWVHEALECLAQEAARSADTHLLKLNFPGFHGIDFDFKDEASHPSGSLKHRLARSLYLYALCNGRLGPEQAVVDASSGSTAISEAWFARLLGLRFIAV
ncbi:MAG TPA: pyridoxal-phosphate dependent enzyme, partial [Rhodanobacter sp.]|nr:pyridoxal-phosphate dependent enzyme [Rhodanobacter sp.]